MLTIDAVLGRILHKRKQANLARLLGVESSVVFNWRSKKQTPSPLFCLLLADLAESQEEKQFLIEQANLDRVRIKRISRVLGIPEPRILDREQKALIDMHENPRDEAEEAVIRMAMSLSRREPQDLLQKRRLRPRAARRH